VSLHARWDGFWYRPVPVGRVAVLRIVLAGYAILSVAQISPLADRASADGMFFAPLPWLRVLGIPRPGALPLTVLNVVLVLALVGAVLGIAARASLWTAAVGYTLAFAHHYSFGNISHGVIPVIVALTALAVAPSGEAWALGPWLRDRRAARSAPSAEDPLASWAVRVIQVALVLFYLAGAWAKVVRTGPGWAWSGALDAAVIAEGSSVGHRLAGHPAALHALALAGFVFEATAFMLLSRRPIRHLWVAAAVCFHLGAHVLMRLDFTGMLLCLLAFYPLEQLPPLVGRLTRRATMRVPNLSTPQRGAR